jgi:hypothetical protein
MKLLNTGPQYTSFMNDELLYILYQIYAPLSILSNHFTHYDLHTGNVMLYEPIKGSYIQYHYHYENHTVTFKSKYIVKIIDYGRSYFLDEPPPRDMYLDLCDSDVCPSCGKYNGYTFLGKHNSYHISSQTRNMSHDLRLLDMLGRYPIYNDYLYNLIQATIYNEHFGTPEVTVKNDWSIGNVNDAKEHLEQLMQLPFFKRNETYSGNKMGDLHIYKDGTPMKFIST